MSEPATPVPGSPAGDGPALLPAEIAVRPLTPSDTAAVAFTLRHLGARSRYQRYLSYGTEKSLRGEITRLTTLDHWHHEVLIACRQHPRIPVGVAEYVRHPGRFDAAELALVVSDAWQRHGVGRLLVETLRERALAAGIRRFTATALRDNRGSIALMTELGPLAREFDGTTVDLVADLTRPAPLRQRRSAKAAANSASESSSPIATACGASVAPRGCSCTSR